MVDTDSGEGTAPGRKMVGSQIKAHGFGLGLTLMLILSFIHLGWVNLYAQPLRFFQELPYDPNLEVTFQGRILKIYLPLQGLASLEVERDGKPYTVFLCPVKYYLHLNPDFKEGDRVEITGAKTFFKRYGIIFMPRHLRNLETGRLYLFRSPAPPYKPVWE